MVVSVVRIVIFFFFSSRRRHTRCLSDWSSDVCSSDLSVILIGGDPGIGKSTLLLQAFAALSQKGLTSLYVTGEESQRQVKMRAERLGIRSEERRVGKEWR